MITTGARWPWLRMWMAALLLIAAALLLMWRIPSSQLVLTASDAILIAGILALIVDPLLKRDLVEDLANEIFQHLLGIDFPPDIRDTFQKALFGLETYREGTEIEASVAKLSENSVLLEVSLRWTIVAAKKTEYQQGMAFEESERGRILQASVTVESNDKDSYSESHPTLTPKPDEPMVLEWKAKKKIVMRKKDHVSAYLKFTVTKGVHDFFTFNFSVPAINPRVRISAKDNLEINASLPDQLNGNEYLYRKVFLPADHIQIRWKPRLSPVVKNNEEVPAQSKRDLSTQPPSQG
ncbi:MAG TPA: hypothetical protein VKV95_04460 [Terriglobia bacterium]|nr:hypothetical protein [Terriglobia bacterium]